MRADAVWMRAGLGALLTLLAVAAVQFLVLRASWQAELASLAARGIEVSPAVISDRFRIVSVVLLLVPPVVASFLAAFVMVVMIRLRMKPLVRAMARIAEGDFEVPLPPPPERDLEPIRQAFERMRLALRDAVQRLAHQDAQRRRLFADLAHELGTPITSQNGLVDALRGARGDSPEERARLLAALERETTRIERLVGDLRDLAMLDDPDVVIALSPGDLGEVVSHAVESFRARRDAGTIELRAEPVPVELDPVRIAQVITNLLTNARRHGPLATPVRVSVARDAGEARVTVEDEGPGVPPDMLARLGERLLRVDPSRDRRTGGHGLGLSIVHAIVQRHRGTVRFENVSGEGGSGLRVVITLPLA